MFEYVARNMPLISKSEQERIQNTTVAIAGVGGTGAWIIESLVRLGIGTLYIADSSVYEVTNMNRQAYSTLNNLGKSKVEVITEMMMNINKDVKIKKFPEGINQDNIEDFLNNVDVVVDGIDYYDFPTRRLVQNEARKRGIPVFLSFTIAFEASMFVFTKESMSFDEFIGFQNSYKSETEYNMPIDRLVPIFPKYILEYTETDIINQILSKKIPKTNLCAPIAAGAFWLANELMIFILERRNTIIAPNCLVFDMYENSCQTLNPVENPLWTQEKLFSR